MGRDFRRQCGTVGRMRQLWQKSTVRGLAVVGMAGALLGCYMPVVDNKDAERARQSAPIPYKQLTPISALPITFQSPEYSEAIKSYPTTRDCLIESEKLSHTPDLRLIDWTRIHQRAHLDVCLWRIFSSLDDFQSIIKWMDFHHLYYSGRKDLSEIKSIEELVYFKGSETFKGYFYWYKALPFRDVNPVPRYALGEFEIELVFREFDSQLMWVTTSWRTTM